MNISIVIPAFNEEKYITRLFTSIAELEIPIDLNLEIIVVLNRCTDNTEGLVREFVAKIVFDDRKNLSSIRNTGIKAASGEWVITIDADSWMATNTLVDIYTAIQSQKVVGGGIAMYPERWSVGIAIGYAMFLLPAVLLRLSFGLYWFKK